MSIVTSPNGCSFGKAKTSVPVFWLKISGQDCRKMSSTACATSTPCSILGALPLMSVNPARQPSGKRESWVLSWLRASFDRLGVASDEGVEIGLDRQRLAVRVEHRIRRHDR